MKQLLISFDNLIYLHIMQGISNWCQLDRQGLGQRKESRQRIKYSHKLVFSVRDTVLYSFNQAPHLSLSLSAKICNKSECNKYVNGFNWFCYWKNVSMSKLVVLCPLFRDNIYKFRNSQSGTNSLFTFVVESILIIDEIYSILWKD